MRNAQARAFLGTVGVASLVGILAGALFVLDLVAQTRVGEGVGYAPVLVLCIWLPGRYTLVCAAIAMTGLVILGSVLAPPVDISLLAETWNRALAIAMIWGNYLFLSNKMILTRALQIIDRRRAHRF